MPSERLRFASLSVYHRETRILYQASGSIPEICRVGSRRIGGRVLRAGPECAVSGYGGKGAARAPQAVRERDPVGRPDSRPYGVAGGQSAVLEAAARGRKVHRAAGALQYVFQSIRRSTGLHAAGRGAQLLLFRCGRSVCGEFFGSEIAAASASPEPIRTATRLLAACRAGWILPPAAPLSAPRWLPDL